MTKVFVKVTMSFLLCMATMVYIGELYHGYQRIHSAVVVMQLLLRVYASCIRHNPPVAGALLPTRALNSCASTHLLPISCTL